MSQPSLAGVHHVKIPVSDLARAQRWYEQVFGLTVEMEFPDQDGVVRGLSGRMPGLGEVMVAMREAPEVARGISEFDPVGFAVHDRAAIEAWAGWLDDLGIDHSPVIDASIGWLLVFNDPDGLEHHLYSWEPHGIDQSGRPGYGRAVRPSAAG